MLPDGVLAEPPEEGVASPDGALEGLPAGLPESVLVDAERLSVR